MIIKEITLYDNELGSSIGYDISVVHYDGSELNFSFEYEDCFEGYNVKLANELINIIKGNESESLLIMHLNCAPKGSLHSMLAYQSLKCPNSITVNDLRTSK